jgi:hypothetical protein
MRNSQCNRIKRFGASYSVRFPNSASGSRWTLNPHCPCGVRGAALGSETEAGPSARRAGDVL